ncbi:MAG: sortase [Nocardioides sp.]
MEDDALASGFRALRADRRSWGEGQLRPGRAPHHHGEPLRRMPELQPGDEIVVETRQWVYSYVLDTGGDDLVIPFTDVWVLDPRPVNPGGGPQPPPHAKRLITLTTCAELFHTDDRMVAFGHSSPAGHAVDGGGAHAGLSSTPG